MEEKGEIMKYELTDEIQKSKNTEEYIDNLKSYLRGMVGIMSIGSVDIKNSETESKKLDDFYSKFRNEFSELDKLVIHTHREILKYQEVK